MTSPGWLPRAGCAPLTGIDRVERAYLRELALRGRPFFLLARTALGWLAIPGTRAPQILAWIDQAEPLPHATPLAKFLARSRRTPALEAALRKLSVARIGPRGLCSWIGRIAPSGAMWLSVGHVNLDARTFGQIRRAGCAKIAVMIHDTIPLDHPEWSGRGAPARFATALRATCQFADLILCPSAVAATCVRRHGWVRQPLLVASLGVDLAVPDVSLLPADLDLAHPYFVALGTIEPRKNLDLLLSVWSELTATSKETTIPHLHLVGQRGWNNDALFRMLDNAPFMGRTVFEHGALPDPAVMALLQGARGFLAPSRAEGFGIPVAEAACLGLPILATDLPVTREILGDYSTYLPPDDSTAWRQAIQALPPRTQAAASAQIRFDWTDHFNLVFSKIE